LRLAQRINDLHGISSAFATLGMITQASDRLDEAETFYTESYTYARLIEHNGLVSRSRSHLAELALARGDFAGAGALLEEALASAQAVGMTWDIPLIMTLLGHLACQQQQYKLAKMRYREALSLYRTFGSPTYTARCLEGFAAAICAEGHYTQATRSCAAAATLREQTQTPLPLAERETFDQVIATARAALGEFAFVREWNAGTTLTHNEAIDDAFSDACV